MTQTSKPTGRRATVRVKTARGRTVSQQRWLQRQLNDPYVAEAKKRGYRSRAVFTRTVARRPVGLLLCVTANHPHQKTLETKTLDAVPGYPEFPG